MKFVTDFNVKGKRVLLRLDFNVPLDVRGNILDDFRIQKAIPTIEYLIKKGARVILMSHLGEPGGRPKKELSLAPVQEKLLEYLDCSIVKAKDCAGEEIEKWSWQMKEGEILLLENLRFRPEEEKNDLGFAKKLSKLGDIFINDAFGVSHRKHASIVGVPGFLPSALGFLFKEEIENLSKITKNPKRPLIGIIGGTKIDSKIKPIKKFLEELDFLLLGGKLADIILRVKGISIGKALPGPETMEIIESLDLTNPKIRLPIDVVVAPEITREYIRTCGPGDVRKNEEVLDIGPETGGVFGKIIDSAKTIFWTGPLGKIEEKKFSIGSFGVAGKIVKTQAFSAAGGRETVHFLREHHLAEKFSYISTGGGSMLEFLAEKTLPGLEALNSQEPSSPKNS